MQLEVVRKVSESPSAEDAAVGYLLGSPVSFEIADRGGDAAELVPELARRYVELGGERPFRAEIAATVITAAR